MTLLEQTLYDKLKSSEELNLELISKLNEQERIFTKALQNIADNYQTALRTIQNEHEKQLQTLKESTKILHSNQKLIYNKLEELKEVLPSSKTLQESLQVISHLHESL